MSTTRRASSRATRSTDAAASGEAVAELARIAARLRAPDGCPWDREQTHASLRPLLLEEAYEVMDAIDSGDPEALRGELGDLLFHVVIHSQLASEAGTFDLGEVARGSAEKLVRRHPHVFGETQLPGDPSKTVLEQWERIKRSERKDAGKEKASLLDGLPRDLPALYTAARALERGARVGIVPARVDLPLDVDDENALGDLLFDLVALAREQGMDAEGALRRANARFADRVRRVEDRARAEGRELASYTPDQLRALWDGSAAEATG